MTRSGILAPLKLLAKPKVREMCRLAEFNETEAALILGLCCEDKTVDQVIDFLPEYMSKNQYKRVIKILKSRLVSWCSGNQAFFTQPEWTELSPYLALKDT